MRQIPLNHSWRFSWLGDIPLDSFSLSSLQEAESVPVFLPHTFAENGASRRGLGAYRRRVDLEPSTQSVYLSFEAVDQSCRILIDGKEAGRHAGGYSRFRVPVPAAAVRAGGFDLLVLADNRVNPHVSPHFGDFTIFGGIPRPISLLTGESAHFDRMYFGTDGLILQTELTDTGDGLIHAEPHTVCAGSAVIRYTVLDPSGHAVLRRGAAFDAPVTLSVPSPAHWNGKSSPCLYAVEADLILDGRTADSLKITVGFRRAEATPEGFRLNGQSCFLRGVAKHQDRAGCFTAVTDPQTAEDFDLIEEIGANAVRLSHYQHPQAAYDECDRRGLLCWAEIPMLKMTEDPELQQNAKQQLTELILQNCHHPSVYCWGIQNEIAMFRDAPFMHEACRELAALAKKLDPFRQTACANLYPVPPESGLNGITDLVGYNYYFGWYYGEWQDYGEYMDAFRAARPEVPVGITEYGADSNLTLHSSHPKTKDYSEEYQALFHEKVYPFLKSRPWLWGAYIWNMFDFSSERRDEGGMKGINGKGLVSQDRMIRKDAFWYYKAQWSSTPVLHLCGSRYALRTGETTEIKVYTNRPEVTLLVNGIVHASLPSDGNSTVLFAGVPLREGENRIQAVSGDLSDEMRLLRVETEPASYTLPVSEDGPVVNWFLQGEKKKDCFSVDCTAQQIVEHSRAAALLRETFPELYRLLAVDFVIPQGLVMRSILARSVKDPDVLGRFNQALQEIPLKGD